MVINLWADKKEEKHANQVRLADQPPGEAAQSKSPKVSRSVGINVEIPCAAQSRDQGKHVSGVPTGPRDGRTRIHDGGTALGVGHSAPPSAVAVKQATPRNIPPCEDKTEPFPDVPALKKNATIKPPNPPPLRGGIGGRSMGPRARTTNKASAGQSGHQTPDPGGSATCSWTAPRVAEP